MGMFRVKKSYQVNAIVKKNRKNNLPNASDGVIGFESFFQHWIAAQKA